MDTEEEIKRILSEAGCRLEHLELDEEDPSEPYVFLRASCDREVLPEVLRKLVNLFTDRALSEDVAIEFVFNTDKGTVRYSMAVKIIHTLEVGGTKVSSESLDEVLSALGE